MNRRRKPMNAQQMAREKLVFRYSNALERGDFDTIATVLREAENDPILERMLIDMDGVYQTEWTPPIVLPSLSSNHNHRQTREDRTMQITYPMPRQAPPASVPRGRWNFAVTLAAAMITLAVFAAVMIARRPQEEQQGNPAISLQQESATPSPEATLTATPIAPTVTLVSATNVSSPQNDAGIILPTAEAQAVLCEGFIANVTTLDGINVFSDSSINGVVVGRMAIGDAVEILSERQVAVSAIGGLWYYARSAETEGWIRGEFVMLNTPCPYFNDVNSTNPCSIITPLGISATPTAAVAVELSPPPLAATGMFETMLLTPTLIPTAEPPCVPGSNIPITPTAGIPYGAWSSAVLREPIEGIPANTPVRISAATYDGTQWLYAISTLDGQINAYAPESALIIYFSPDVTPTARFDDALRSGGFVLVTTERVGDIPAGARVQIISASYDGNEWWYDIVSQNQAIPGQAREWQLQYEFGVTLGAPTPTARFWRAIGTGFYAAITTEPVGNIPAGTRVQISSAMYDGVEWAYQIRDEAGRDNVAVESQLALAPDYTPGMPTPTAAFFGRGNLILLDSVGRILAGTIVQATSGYYNGTEWVYGVTTLDGNLGAEARASQLRLASPSDPPATWTPAPTFVPSPTIPPIPT